MKDIDESRPLALAGSVLRDGQTATQTTPGVAINDNPFGATAVTSGLSSTVRIATARSNGPNTSRAAFSGGLGTNAVSHRITTSVKKIKDAVSGLAGGHDGRAPKPGADSPSRKANADRTSTKDK